MAPPTALNTKEGARRHDYVVGHEMGHGATRSPADLSRARFGEFGSKPTPT